MKTDSALTFKDVRGVILIMPSNFTPLSGRIVIIPKAFQKTDLRPFLKIRGESQRLVEFYVLWTLENHDLA